MAVISRMNLLVRFVYLSTSSSAIYLVCVEAMREQKSSAFSSLSESLALHHVVLLLVVTYLSYLYIRSSLAYKVRAQIVAEFYTSLTVI